MIGAVDYVGGVCYQLYQRERVTTCRHQTNLYLACYEKKTLPSANQSLPVSFPNLKRAHGSLRFALQTETFREKQVKTDRLIVVYFNNLF